MRGWDCFACATAELAGWLILVAAVVRTTMVLRGLLWLAVVVAFGVAVWALRRNAEGGNGEPAGPGGAPGHES